MFLLTDGDIKKLQSRLVIELKVKLTLSLRRALNFFRQSTVSCRWSDEATRPCSNKKVKIYLFLFIFVNKTIINNSRQGDNSSINLKTRGHQRIFFKIIIIMIIIWKKDIKWFTHFFRSTSQNSLFYISHLI